MSAMPTTLTADQRAHELRALDRRIGKQAAEDQLLIDTPLHVLNRGLDLDLDQYAPGYVEGYVAAAALAARKLRGQITSALEVAEGLNL
jgi:hypothetical protein